MRFLRCSLLLGLAASLAACSSPVVYESELRAPAYPLVTIDPNTSAWSMADRLYDDQVRHWTGREFPLIGVISVDGQDYRFMGTEQQKTNLVVPDAGAGCWDARYVMDRPAGKWMAPGYDDSAWKCGKAAFATPDDGSMGTEWQTEHVWVRREVELSSVPSAEGLNLLIHNDDDAEFYVNGHLVYACHDCNHNRLVPLTDEAYASLHEGWNVFAAHCRNTGGLATLDFGMVQALTPDPRFANTATQTSVNVQAMNTYYSFNCGPVELQLTFTAPMFMDRLDLLSRPVNYISYKVVSADGQAHDVSLYFEASPLWTVDQPYQKTVSDTYKSGKLVFCKAGSVDQKILGRWGDDRRIDWGYFHMAGDRNYSAEVLDGGNMAMTRNLGKVKEAADKLLIGYDDVYSIQYFGTNLRPYWNRKEDQTIEKQFQLAYSEYSSLMKESAAFDAQIFARAQQAGGRRYAELCALAYRQSIAAHKLVESPSGELLWFSKENDSNGSIGTVDVTYPSAPLFLLYNVDLAQALMNHIFEYSESGRWTKGFPAHDVGTYPLANGQTYGGDMPVEEAGNMLVLTAAAAHYSKSAEYARKHWDSLTQWTEYLCEYGLDPQNQLCTDDFAGHFAHNVNLSVKAIVGIGCYAYLAEMLGMGDVAESYMAKAKEMAAAWMQMADDGDHYRLTFDKAGTWSQKYNLVWDKLLGLGIFPEEVLKKEVAYYLGKQNVYGLPLDCRMAYTKLDWIVWTATLANSNEDFQAFIDPMYDFVNETVDRVPMSDWTWTDKGHRVGFKARSVVGGYFIKMLEK